VKTILSSSQMETAGAETASAAIATKFPELPFGTPTAFRTHPASRATRPAVPDTNFVLNNFLFLS
jgi:hypothetical protein